MAFDFYFETCADGEAFKDEAMICAEVKKAVIDRLYAPTLEEYIRKAASASLNPKDFLGSVHDVDHAFEKAKFNDGAKFGILRISRREIPQLAQFLRFTVVLVILSLLKLSSITMLRTKASLGTKCFRAV